MIIVNIIGGLGNQMFQYAFAYTISQKKQSQLKLDICKFDTYDLRKYSLDHYYIDNEIADHEEIGRLKYKKANVLARFFRKQPSEFSDSYYRESSFQFDKDVANKFGDIYIEGYWQSEKYFQDYREDLLQLFTLKESIHSKSKQYQFQIQACQSVSLHIRRGDYVNNVHINSVHGICELNYYRQATSLLVNKVIKPHFFIFSDDITWAKENLEFIKHRTFIELELDIPDHEEMLLMSQCQHNIIANSTFSWWGAWLNQNPDKVVIAPLSWFLDSSIDTSDLIPNSWICL